MIVKRVRVLVVWLLVAATVPLAAEAQQRRNDHWVTTWATAVVARGQAPSGGRRGGGAPGTPGAIAPATAAPSAPVAAGTAPPVGPPAAGRQGGPVPQLPVTITNQTLRQIVHVSVGGSRVRVVLSNAFGTAPVGVGAARVALRTSEAQIDPQTARPLTVAGKASFTIVAGGIVLSDPMDLTVPPFADVAIDLYVPDSLGMGPSPLTSHTAAWQTNYLSETGNHVGAVSFAVAARPTSWFLLSRVEVAGPSRAGTVVAFGDSITDGSRSTVDSNNRWPDHLARRLAAQRGGTPMGVANAGIGGNQLLADGQGVSALARFDRDALLHTGVTHVVILEGTNDIGLARENASPTAADLIAAHQQLIERARARGLKVYGATLLPFEGAAYWTAVGEAKRVALNQWIRTSGAYDAVIDFDAVIRDPMQPTKMQALFDSGDHLHPNGAGYKAMGEAIDLSLFRP